MISRLRLLSPILLLALALAACGGNGSAPTSVPPTATLRGAIVPTRIPTNTPQATPSPSDTPTLTNTPTGIPPTVTSTSSPTATGTSTNTPTATNTSSPTATSTNTPSGPTATSTPLVAVPIAYGDTVSGTIDDQSPILLYSFQAQSGDVVGVQMNTVSGTLDPFIILQDANGNELARNDDDPLGAGRNAYLRDFTISTTGTYTIVATRYRQAAGGSQGSFSLRLETTSGQTTGPTPQTTANVLQYGSTVTGTINNTTPEVRYAFDAQAGDLVNIRIDAQSGNLDPFLILLGPDGAEVARNDDDPQNNTRNVFLRDFSIPVSGQYTIVATRFRQAGGTSSGDFSLTLEGGQGSIPPSPTPAAPIPPTLPPIGETQLNFGSTVTGTINNDVPEIRYTFNARAGDGVGIQMRATSGDLDPLIILLDATGSEIARNDDDPLVQGRNSFLHDFRIPADGMYTIVATRFRQAGGTSSGSFTLSLMPGGRGPLPPTPGQPSTGGTESISGHIDNVTPRQNFQFDAQAGEIIGIQMNATSGDLDPLLILVGPNGQEVARNDDDPQGQTRNSYLRNFRIPVTGTYTIVATRFREQGGTSTGDFTLTLVRGG